MFYCSNISEYSEEFMRYLSKNINSKNRDKILGQNNDLCNELINNPNIDNKLFDIIIKYVNEKISFIDEEFKNKKSRIKQLIEKNLLEINNDNIGFLVQNGLYRKIWRWS